MHDTESVTLRLRMEGSASPYGDTQQGRRGSTGSVIQKRTEDRASLGMLRTLGRGYDKVRTDCDQSSLDRCSP